MKGYTSDTIRNIALVGHGSSGKTTFIEAALLATGVISRLGRVEDGNTVSDFDKMEAEKGYSISMSIVPVEYNKVKLNFLDTPGFFDFVGEVNCALRAAEAAAIFVDASSGIQVGTEKAWASCKQFNVPRFFVINKTDKDNLDIPGVIASLKAKFGSAVVSMDDTDAINEAIAETSEELMDKFFGGEEFTEEEFSTGLSQAILDGGICPVFTCSALKGEGIKEVLDAFIKYVPKPTAHEPYETVDGDPIPCGDGPAALFVFKTIADQFGKISLAKVIRGSVNQGMELLNSTQDKNEKLSSVYYLRGKTQGECLKASYGDIVALGKLAATQTGDTLCDKANPVQFPKVVFPQPTLFTAIEPKSKADEDKVSSGLKKLMEEDPSFCLERNTETRQTLLGTQGDIQANILMAKLKDKNGVEVSSVPQKVAYRETIMGSSDVQGKHKKQNGGSGQYGDVYIKFSRSEEEFEFVDSVVGGVVPRNFIPAVEKGLRECMEKGPLAGCKCQNIRAELYYGSYHPVDSDEVSFKAAARLAFNKGIPEAKPVLLEPIMKLDITVPDDYVGAVMGDLPNRRGIVMGMDPVLGGGQTLHAEAPQSELFDYAISLRAMTQARGSFTMAFDHYATLPANLTEKVVAAYKAEQEDA
ncbi:MAG: elongation factor G [Firmicutes bacterium]|nr:elongation factor G [Bacillota bacterium]